MMIKKTTYNFFFEITLACLMITNVQAGVIRASDSLRNEEIHDYYFSIAKSGLVTIEVFETIEDETDFDPEINLFVNDGLLDLDDFIENDDDGGSDYSGFGSYISRALGVGNYLLRVGFSNFGNKDGTDPGIIELTNPHWFTNSPPAWLVEEMDYDIIITGDFVEETDISPIPLPTSIWLFGSCLIGLFRIRKPKTEVS